MEDDIYFLFGTKERRRFDNYFRFVLHQLDLLNLQEIHMIRL